MKPIPTLMTPLKTVDLATGAEVSASKERSDACAVPAASVVVEAMVAKKSQQFGWQGDVIAYYFIVGKVLFLKLIMLLSL